MQSKSNQIKCNPNQMQSKSNAIQIKSNQINSQWNDKAGETNELIYFRSFVSLLIDFVFCFTNWRHALHCSALLSFWLDCFVLVLVLVLATLHNTYYTTHHQYNTARHGMIQTHYQQTIRIHNTIAERWNPRKDCPGPAFGPVGIPERRTRAAVQGPDGRPAAARGKVEGTDNGTATKAGD